MLCEALGRTKGMWHVSAVRDGEGGVRFPCTLLHRSYDKDTCEYGGTLWVGGKIAAERHSTLSSNGITCRCQAIDPTSYTLHAAKHQGVEYKDELLAVDRAFTGKMGLEEFVNLVKFVVDLVAAGEHVLVFCFNGSHRSAMLACAALMMLTRESAETCMDYVWRLRRVVDFWTRFQTRWTGQEILQWAEDALHSCAVVTTLALFGACLPRFLRFLSSLSVHPMYV